MSVLFPQMRHTIPLAVLSFPRQVLMILITRTLSFFLDCAVQLAGSQFPDQGLNLGHGSENPES